MRLAPQLFRYLFFIVWGLTVGMVAEAPALAYQVLSVGGGTTISAVTPPALLNYVRPPYTDEALLLGIEGTVSVDAQFGNDGSFRILRIVNSLGFGLDENALATLRAWSFGPALNSGAQVGVIARVDIEFRLPVRFNYSNGSFRFESGAWHEYSGMQRMFSFREISRTGGQFLIFDSSRSMYLRLPMAGGYSAWSTDGVIWNQLYDVAPVPDEH